MLSRNSRSYLNLNLSYEVTEQFNQRYYINTIACPLQPMPLSRYSVSSARGSLKSCIDFLQIKEIGTARSLAEYQSHLKPGRQGLGRPQGKEKRGD